MFPFHILRAIIGGTSAIDLDALRVDDLADADSFLQAYGYDLSHAADRAAVDDIRRRSVSFLEEVLLDPGEQIPLSVRDTTDIRRHLVEVSTQRPTTSSLWACALLRVMHATAHADSDLAERFGAQIRAQVLGRFRPHITRGPHGLRLGDLPLLSFEERGEKPPHSVILKLLQKPENVAAAVFDRVALRFVTADRLSALLVVRYLRAHHIIQFANIKPSRSRNSLVDLERLERTLRDAEIDPETLVADVQAWPYPQAADSRTNPHSGRTYHAIQFTCRQRIRVTDGSGSELAFFFPFEVQILDRESYDESRIGDAAHAAYKARQREVCRRRVLGPLASVR